MIENKVKAPGQADLPETPVRPNVVKDGWGSDRVARVVRRIITYAMDLVSSKRVQIEPTVTHVLHGLEMCRPWKSTATRCSIGPAQVVLV